MFSVHIWLDARDTTFIFLLSSIIIVSVLSTLSFKAFFVTYPYSLITLA